MEKVHHQQFEDLPKKQEELKEIQKEEMEIKGAKERSRERGEFSELVSREKNKLKEFFGYDIDVPPLPEEITLEKYEQWKELSFELHYLPEEDMTKDRDLPGWQKKPNDWFYNAIGERKISPDATKLSGAWVLIDSREKPRYDNSDPMRRGEQMYENDDEIGNAFKKLRQRRVVKDHRKDDSRFNISWDELNKDEVKKALAKILGIDPENLRLPRAIEWNYLGNAFHKEWGETNVLEWFEDEYEKGRERLSGGGSGGGGLSDVKEIPPSFSYIDFGFRPLVVFSSLK